MNQIAQKEIFTFNGLTYEMSYGSHEVELPFAIKCRDFQLDRYPGSEEPSSFASEVTVIDTVKGVNIDKRIYMNNVMDYSGYRFFQSGYEPDESGTRLSVSYDWWGTNLSYLGYLMMGIGMLLSLIAPVGRFRELNGLLKKSYDKRQKIKLSIIAVLLMSSTSFAADSTQVHDHHNHSGNDHSGHDHSAHQHEHAQEEEEYKPDLSYSVMSEEHSDEIATLMVQHYNGRIAPLHTICDEILRKVSRQNKYGKYNAVQTVMSMHMNRDYWQTQPIIYVSSKGGWRDRLKMKGSRVAFNDLLTPDGRFIFTKEYNRAHAMDESERGEPEKKVIKLAERFQVAGAVFSMTWDYLRVLPMENDPTNKWYSILSVEVMQKDPRGTILATRYLQEMHKATLGEGSYKKATKYLNDLKKFQRKIGKKIAPSESKIQLEVSYNKMEIFKHTYQSYLVLGLIMLIIFFIQVFVRPTPKAEKKFRRIMRVMFILTSIIFVYHGSGVVMRWFISGHEPWSNAYEAVVFIGWVVMLLGLIFSKKHMVILAVAAILAALMVFVTEMNLFDPEITPLKPVLQSYWLMIHVAIITGSYAPLGISAILGTLNLFLYIFRNKKNGEILTLNINDLTYISEMTMTIGLFMLTIGTFLGGIWANESWGRYWGWDPKETWALVAILMYAIILHFRFIPGLKKKITFNIWSLWGYSTILFTFFGVNFYLVGLHSYAQGDGLGEFPTSVIVIAIVFAVFTLIAWLRNKQYSRSLKEE